MARLKDWQIKKEERRSRPMTLGDLQRAAVNVFCWCNRCGHNATLPTTELVAKLGPAQPVPEIGAKLRCSSCASKDVATRPAWPGLGQVTRHS